MVTFLLLACGLAGVASQWVRANRHEIWRIRNATRLIGIYMTPWCERPAQHSWHGLAGIDRRCSSDWRGPGTRSPDCGLEELRDVAASCLGDFVGLGPTVWDDFPSPVEQIALSPISPLLAIGLRNGTFMLREIERKRLWRSQRQGVNPGISFWVD